MPEFDLYVCGEKAVLDLDISHLSLGSILHIHNDISNPIDRIFLNLPNIRSTSSLTDVYSIIDLQGSIADLIILLNTNTHIHNGAFKGFDRVLVTDHSIVEKNNNEVILDQNKSCGAKLIIDNFRTKEGYILCSQVALLNGGNVQEILGIKLHGRHTEAKFVGIDNKNYLTIGKLAIISTIESLELDKVRINQEFDNSLIKNLLTKNVVSTADWNLTTKEVEGLSIMTQAVNNRISTEHIEIHNLLYTRGIFHISAKSYINFKIESGGRLYGVDLVLDMSESSHYSKKVTFPAHKFQFDSVTLINADDVTITFGGTCRQFLLTDCAKVVLTNVVAKDIKYRSTKKLGYLYCTGTQVLDNFLIIGDVSGNFDRVEVKNLEGSGLCSFKFSSATKCEIIKLNLNLDASNPMNNLTSSRGDSLNIRIENDGNDQTTIGTILAKLSTFYVKGNVKLGAVLIQPIDKISTLLWVDVGFGTRLKLDRLFVGFDHDIEVGKDGTISVIRTKNLLAGSDLFASVSHATSQNSIYIKAGKGIRFDGKLYVIDGDIGLFSKYGDVFVKGTMTANNSIILAAEYGAVSVHGATLEAKLVTLYSGTSSYLSEAIIKAQEIVSYSLSHYIQGQSSKLEASRIVIIAEGDVSIGLSNVHTNQLIVKANNVSIQNSQIITYDLFVQSVHDFLLASSGIRLVEYSHALFANNPAIINEGIIQGGFHISKDVTLIGIFSNDKQKILSKLHWQKVDVDSNETMAKGRAYIDANRGFIIGSTLDAKDSVIIKTAHSLDIVPLILYNETMLAGGFNISSIKEVVSRINAGLIDIDAGKSANFIGTLLKATVGNIKADIIQLLASPEDIRTNQGRIKILKDWNIDVPMEIEQVNVGRYFNFTTSTNIVQRVSNLSLYDNYVSRDLSFTQIDGDIILDKPWHSKYNKLYLNATNGKILIVSKDLQNIYRGAGGKESGKIAAYNSRTVIGGDNIYLSADQLIMQGSKFEVTGDLQIVTNSGVYILPVAVHERLMYHQGSKTVIEEYIVRQVISEINAGFLNIKAGGVLEAVSALIKATGVNLDVKDLNLRAEYDIFEKHIHFTGKKKVYGGRQVWHDHSQNHFVMPTIINTGSIYAKINGDTTIEAAQILATEESVMQGLGNIHLLPKYDIHLHDHTSKKSYLFKCHGGKLTVNGTKTVKEHFYGESPVPTIYYSGGSFFAYSEGMIHLLGAKVVANDIYLLGQKGVKIEAAPFHQHSLVTISETGLRTGYNVGNGSASVSAELYKDIDKFQQSQLFYEAAEVIAKTNLVVVSKDGDLEVISSKARFAKADVRVRGLNIHTHKEVTTQEQTDTNMSTGISAGVQENISASVSRAGHLLNKTGTHWLDVLDRGLNSYQLHGELQQIKSDIQTLTTGEQAGKIENLQNLKSVKFGVWASGKVSTQSNVSQLIRSIDNEIIGGDINIQVDDKAIIEGIRCHVDNFALKAGSLSVKASHDEKKQETYSSEVSITIPIKGDVEAGVAMSNSEGSRHHVSYHSDNMIIAKGRLEVDIAGDGKVSGVKLQASEILVRAKNLVVESLQDVITERMRSMEINVGSGGIGSLGVKTHVTSRDAGWTNAIGSIIGTQVVNIVVQQTLEIAGGLIANAEVDETGKLKNKGKARVEAGSIIAKQLHDYDNGKSFGLGIALNSKVDAKGNVSFGVGLPVVCGFNDRTRDILPTIGQGEIIVIETGGLELLNRSVTGHVSRTTSDSASLNATIPVSDMIEFVQSQLNKPSAGVAAGDSGILSQKPDIKEELEDKNSHDPETVALVQELKANGLILESEDLDVSSMSIKELLNLHQHKWQLTNLDNNVIIETLIKENAEVKEVKTKYSLKTHIRSIGLKVESEGIVEALSPGHIYFELENQDTEEIKFFGKYPERDNYIIDKAKISDEKYEHDFIKNLMKETGKSFLISRTVHLTLEQHKKLDQFVTRKKEDAGTFVLLLADCSNFGEELFEQINMKHVYSQLFTKAELAKVNPIFNFGIGTKIDLVFGNRDTALTVKGSNIEEIAKKYELPRERIVKKYDIKPHEKTLPGTLNIDVLYNNILRDQEYLILPPKD